MNWITKEQAEKAGKGTQLEAAKSSWERWNQGATCSYEKLRDGMLSGEAVFCAGVSSCAEYCGLCRYKRKNNTNCKTDCIGKEQTRNCCNEFDKAEVAFSYFQSDTSRQNCDTFQTKAKALCGVIQKFMDGLEEKKELKHLDYWFARDGNLNIFAKEFNRPQRDCNLDGSNLITNIGSNYEGQEIAGNLKTIFDDLKRNAEDLREFDVKDVYGDVYSFRLSSDASELWITDKTAGERTSFKINTAQEIHQKLGVILATALRDERKGK